MRISVVLFTSKTLANGHHPISLRIYENGKNKYKSLGISCDPNFWQADTDFGQVTYQDPDYLQKNEIIKQAYQDATQSKGDTIGQPTNLVDVFPELIKQSPTRSTKKRLEVVWRYLQTLPRPLLSLDKFNQTRANQIRERVLQDKQGQRGTAANDIFQKILQAYRFANTRGYIKSLKPVKFKRIDIEPKGIDETLTDEDYLKIIWEYKERMKRNSRKHDHHQSSHALFLFVLMVAFQGIPPVDIAQIKVSDLSVSRVNSIPYDPNLYNTDPEYRQYFKTTNQSIEILTLKYRRTKTGQSVVIVTDYELIKPIIAPYLQGKGKFDYLLPILDPVKMSTLKGFDLEKYRDIRVTYYFEKHAKILKSRSSWLSKRDICSKPFTYYEARRMFATMLYYRGVPEYHIQKMIGHKPSVLLQHYVKPLSAYEQATHIRSIFYEPDEPTITGC